MVQDYRALVCTRSVSLTRTASKELRAEQRQADERDERQNAHAIEVIAKRQNQYQSKTFSGTLRRTQFAIFLATATFRLRIVLYINCKRTI